MQIGVPIWVFYYYTLEKIVKHKMVWHNVIFVDLVFTTWIIIRRTLINLQQFILGWRVARIVSVYIIVCPKNLQSSNEWLVEEKGLTFNLICMLASSRSSFSLLHNVLFRQFEIWLTLLLVLFVAKFVHLLPWEHYVVLKKLQMSYSKYA
jgi:hypothetical protein